MLLVCDVVMLWYSLLIYLLIVRMEFGWSRHLCCCGDATWLVRNTMANKMEWGKQERDGAISGALFGECICFIIAINIGEASNFFNVHLMGCLVDVVGNVDNEEFV